MTLFGIAAIIAALAPLVLAFYVGLAWLTWSRRCHPRNPSFRPPSLPGSRPDE